MKTVVIEPGQRHRVDCAVVIVTYNSARDVASLLESLSAAADGLAFRVIVVDNGSADDTVARVREHPDVICVETGANLGYSGGINVGRQHAGEYVALAVLNPDLILEPGALREMFTALGDPAVGLVVPMLIDFEGRRDQSIHRDPTLTGAFGEALFGSHFARRPAKLSETVRDEREYHYCHPIDWAVGAAILISAACDHAVGAWDEEFFLYSEEVDYAVRARAAGFRVEYVPEARARHRKAGSGQSHALVALSAISRIRYFEKHGKSASLMRAVVLLHMLLRAVDPSHRAALLLILRRSSWDPLISGLKAGSTKGVIIESGA